MAEAWLQPLDRWFEKPMSGVDIEVASAFEARFMLAALRRLSWTARRQVMETLRTADTRLWRRCCVELSPDEILFSGLVLAEAEDHDMAIPLPDTLRPVRRR